MNATRRDFLKCSAALSWLAARDVALKTDRIFAAQHKQKSSELAQYDALGLAELIKQKKLAPLELVEDTLKRIERVNPQLNAVLTKLFDVEKARTRAKQNLGDGPLTGVPILL